MAFLSVTNCADYWTVNSMIVITNQKTMTLFKQELHMEEKMD